MKALKLWLIIAYANLRGKTCVDFFGGTYIVTFTNKVTRIK